MKNYWHPNSTPPSNGRKTCLLAGCLDYWSLYWGSGARAGSLDPADRPAAPNCKTDAMCADLADIPSWAKAGPLSYTGHRALIGQPGSPISAIVLCYQRYPDRWGSWKTQDLPLLHHWCSFRQVLSEWLREVILLCKNKAKGNHRGCELVVDPHSILSRLVGWKFDDPDFTDTRVCRYTSFWASSYGSGPCRSGLWLLTHSFSAISCCQLVAYD